MILHCVMVEHEATRCVHAEVTVQPLAVLFRVWFKTAFFFQVLRAKFPGVHLAPDVTGLQQLPPDTEIVAAGFPCIDVSRAGLRAGVHAGTVRCPRFARLFVPSSTCQGDQQTTVRPSLQSTGLVRHVFRLLQTAIDAHRPVPWILFENVEALLDRCGPNGNKPAVHYITAALEELGYSTWAHRVISSAAFGVPNKRKRVFIVAAWSADARDVLLAQVRACLQCVTAL